MNGLTKALEHHPVAVCFDCQRSFHMYNGGVYEADPNCGTQRNHCILAVGYGTDPETKKDYTLMKNSWGAKWGDHGYVKMEIKGGSGNCGMANIKATYTVVE
jgi:C1A family cysteine protease